MGRYNVPKSDHSDDMPELEEEYDEELSEGDFVSCSESTTGDSMEVELGGTCSESITTTDSM